MPDRAASRIRRQLARAVGERRPPWLLQRPDMIDLTATDRQSRRIRQ
jgi:hypothetical protein